MSGTQCHAQMTNQMSFTVYSSRCLIREFQTGLREDPESMLYVLLVLKSVMLHIPTCCSNASFIPAVA